MKNRWFETVFKNHCCKIPDKTWVFVRINKNFSSEEKTEFSARKTLFGRNYFNEMTVMAEMMLLLNKGESEVEITQEMFETREDSRIFSEPCENLRVNSLKTLYEIDLKFSVNAPAMLTCLLKDENWQGLSSLYRHLIILLIFTLCLI